MPPNFVALLIVGVLLASAVTVGLGAWVAQSIGPGTSQGLILGTTALAAALLYLRQRR